VAFTSGMNNNINPRCFNEAVGQVANLPWRHAADWHAAGWQPAPRLLAV
jgi:hypothetical protein